MQSKHKKLGVARKTREDRWKIPQVRVKVAEGSTSKKGNRSRNKTGKREHSQQKLRKLGACGRELGEKEIPA